MSGLEPAVVAAVSKAAGGVASAAVKPIAGAIRHRLARSGHGRTDIVTALRRGDLEMTRPSTLRLLMQQPNGLTKSTVDRILASPEIEDLAKILVSAELLDTAATYRERLRDSCFETFRAYTAHLRDRHGRAVVLGTKELREYSDRVFLLLHEQCSRAASALVDQLENPAQSFEWAYHRLAVNHLSAIEDALAGERLHLAGTAEREQSWVERYVGAYEHAHSSIEIPDLSEKRVVPHQELYIEPTFSPTSKGAMALARTDPPEATVGALAIGQDRLLDLVGRTVILGYPGAGKSTTSAWLALQAWQRDRRLPVFLPLKNIVFDDNGFSVIGEITTRLTSRYQCPPPAGFVEKKAIDGGLIVVFDGLDELVDNTNRRNAVRVVESFANAHPLCSVVVTSRVVGYKVAALNNAEFDEFHIEPFDRAQVETYFRHWLRIQPGETEVDHETLIRDFVATSVEIQELTSNPLLLAFICILYRGYRHIPRRRADLYRRCVELLLTDWDRARGISMELPETEDYEIVLSNVAHSCLTDVTLADGLRDVDVLEIGRSALLEEKTGDPDAARRIARNLLGLCRGRGWIFTDVGLTRDDEDLFSFTHRSFMEYFAALQIDRVNETVDDLAEALHLEISNGRWEILGQISLALRERRAKAGGSRTALQLMARAPVPGSELLHADEDGLHYLDALERSTAMHEFLAAAQEAVTFNEDATDLLISGAFDLMMKNRLRPMARLLGTPGPNRRDLEERVAALLSGELAGALPRRGWERSEQARTRVWGAIHVGYLADVSVHREVPGELIRRVRERIRVPEFNWAEASSDSMVAWSIALQIGAARLIPDGAAVWGDAIAAYSSVFESCNPPIPGFGPRTSLDWIVDALHHGTADRRSRSSALRALSDLSELPLDQLHGLAPPTGYAFPTIELTDPVLVVKVRGISRKLLGHRPALQQGWVLLMMGALDGATSIGRATRQEVLEAWGLVEYFHHVSRLDLPIAAEIGSWLVHGFDIWQGEPVATS